MRHHLHCRADVLYQLHVLKTTVIILILIAAIWIVLVAHGQPIPKLATQSSFVTVTNAPIYHNPRVMQWDGYTNCWMELQSCTNLAEGKWQTEQVFFFPTNADVDFTNRQKFFKVEVKHRYFTNAISTNT